MLTVIMLTVVMLSVILNILQRGARKLTGENLKVVWAKFSTLSWAVFIMSAIARYGSTRNHLKLKTRPRFCPVSISLSFLLVYKCNKFYDIQTRQGPKGKWINAFLKNEFI
jgi:hypothetical protein